MSKISTPERTDTNLLKQIKTAYDVLQGNELFKDLKNILKNENKIALFDLGLYKARIIKEKEECGLPID